MDVWYSWRLPPAFSYNALGYLKGTQTQNILVRKNKVHLDYNDIHFIHIYRTHDYKTLHGVPNYKMAQKLFHRTNCAE